MLTARADTMRRRRRLEAGADDYVRKPFDLPELIARDPGARSARAGAGRGRRGLASARSRSTSPAGPSPATASRSR
jgi:DNA-binding response OmpR family regulator